MLSRLITFASLPGLECARCAGGPGRRLGVPRTRSGRSTTGAEVIIRSSTCSAMLASRPLHEPTIVETIRTLVDPRQECDRMVVRSHEARQRTLGYGSNGYGRVAVASPVRRRELAGVQATLTDSPRRTRSRLSIQWSILPRCICRTVQCVDCSGQTVTKHTVTQSVAATERMARHLKSPITNGVATCC
jgi:hypothetical protein